MAEAEGASLAVEPPPEHERAWRPFAVGVCAALILFCAVLSAAMLFRYAQERTADPLNDKALLDLRAKFLANPEDDAAKQAIRQKDLVVRRDFFAIQWHLNSGAWVLAVSVAIVVLLLNVLIISRAPAPEQDSLGAAGGVWREVDSRRTAVGVFALTLLGLALVSAFAVKNWRPEEGRFLNSGAPSGMKVDNDRRP
jgi:hypothetical protein